MSDAVRALRTALRDLGGREWFLCLGTLVLVVLWLYLGSPAFFVRTWGPALRDDPYLDWYRFLYYHVNALVLLGVVPLAVLWWGLGGVLPGRAPVRAPRPFRCRRRARVPDRDQHARPHREAARRNARCGAGGVSLRSGGARDRQRALAAPPALVSRCLDGRPRLPARGGPLAVTSRERPVAPRPVSGAAPSDGVSG